MPANDPRPALGLRPIINVSGTMTSLGASIVVPEAIAAMGELMPHFVEMADLHRLASDAIARATGGEAGFVTASCSAGITLSVAAAMTGTDLAAIERLPDAAGLKDEVVLLAGHMVDYGAPVDYFDKAADWEWTYTSRNGNRLHVVNRGFITSPTQAYGIYWSTLDSSWAANQKNFALVVGSFRPAND